MKLRERALRWAGLRVAQARICTLQPGSNARAMNLIDTISPEDIRRRAEALGPWFHNIELRGVWTAPNHFLGNYPSVKWRTFAGEVPADLTGKTVLDIGCNGGFYSLEMKKRGADRVLGIDFDEDYLVQARFAANVSGLDIEFQKLSVYDVGALQERFDLVLFMGVLYHLRHPLLALDLIHAHVAKDMLVFQSMQRGAPEVDDVAENYTFWEAAHFDRPGYPKMHFIEHRYADDPTNWWAPNAACVEAMLRSSGFEIVSHPEDEVYICRRTDAPYGAGAVYPSRGSHA
jgi:tRNA (mo5U34)-methyltransferase